MGKVRKSLIALLAVLSIGFITLGVSLAFFDYTKNGTTENAIKSGSITFIYDEQNRQGNGITIEDALPLSDASGKLQTTAFNFQVRSTTASSITVPYEITLRQKAGTDDIGSIVKVYLATVASYDAAVNTETELVTSKFSELTSVTKNGYSEKRLYQTSVPVNSSSYSQNYRLKMWIDGSTDYSADSNGVYPYNNKTFTVMVNVYATGSSN